MATDLAREYFLQGNCFYQSGDYSGAIQAYEAALAIRSDYASALNNMGFTRQTMGEPDAAIGCYLSALEVDPGHVDTLFNLGCLLCQQGRSEDSIPYYQRAIYIDPGQGRFHLNLGNAFMQVGLCGRAVESYRRALELDPSDAGAQLNIGNAYLKADMLDEAVTAYSLAHSLAPSDVSIMQGLAIGLRLQGFILESLRCSELAYSVQPNPLNIFGQVFTYSVSALSGSHAMLDAASKYWSLLLSRDPELSGTSVTGPSSEGLGLSLSARRLRIGILSGEIGEHCVSTFIAPFLEHYSRDRFEVEVISTIARGGERSLMLNGKVENSFIADPGDPGARGFIRGRCYDLILETSGFTDYSGLPILSRRCAPIQCHYIGFHASTGLSTIDYFIGDDELTPPAFDVQFQEQVWRLPRAWMASIPYANPPAADCQGLGVAPVLAAFSQIAKIGPETIRFWAAALKRVPSSRLLIKDRYAKSLVAAKRILGQLSGYGISADRVSFMPRDLSWHEHMARYNQVDLALDTTPWSSATTAFDALSMGVPMVAIRGGCTASRMSSSILKASGHPEWVVSEPEVFADVVESLLSDLDGLRAGKGSLQRQILASPLFDAKDMARHLEDAFEQMVRQQRL